MTETCVRETTRAVRLEGSTETLRMDYGSASIRPDSAVETLRQTEKGDDYEVQFSGPRQTSKGLYHATNHGRATYDDKPFGRSVDEIPASLAAFLVGPAVLRAAFGGRA